MPRPNERPPSEADALTTALELELKMKRAAWERGKSQRGYWRALSILFLLLVIAGGLCAWLYFGAAMSGRTKENPAVETVR